MVIAGPIVADSPAARLQFAAAAVGRKPEEVTLASPGAGKGGSGARIATVLDGDRHLLGVLKVYNGCGECDEDVRAMQRLQSGFDKVKAVRPLAEGVTTRNGKPVGIVVMAPAAGTGNDDLLRPETFGPMTEAVKGTAQALAELHTRPAGSGQGRPDKYLATWVTMVQQALGGLAPHAAALAGLGIDLAVVKQQVGEAIEAVKKDPGGCSLTHGDAHPGNFFWDGKNTTMIDVGSLADSMDANGNPIGMAAHDVAKYYQQLDVDGTRFGVSKPQIHELQQTFLESYNEAAAVRPTAAAMRFFSLGMAVHTLRTALGWYPHGGAPPEIEALIHVLADNLKNQLTAGGSSPAPG